jgi:hypothetical protein
MLFNQPFTGAAEFKAGAVHEEVKRTDCGPAKRRQNQPLAAAAHRGVIRQRECEPEQRY